MILAGGLSTRLYPLTRRVPKPLVPLVNVPNAVHLIRYLRSYGIREIAINLHYHAESIERALGDGARYGVRLEYLHEPTLLGSAGAVKQMGEFFDGTFVVIGCDEVTDMNLEGLVAFHRQRAAEATIALVPVPDVTQYGVVVIEADGRVVEFQEKPAPGTEKSHLVNTGVYVFEPALLERIPAGEFHDFGKQVFPAMQAERAAFYGLEMRNAYWADIGTPGEYRRATGDVLEGRLRLPLAEAADAAAPSDTQLGAGATTEGPVRVGRGVSLGAGTRIVGPTVLGDGTTVGRDALLVRSILWDDVTVGAGARLSDCIVGSSYEIAPGDVRQGEILAND